MNEEEERKKTLDHHIDERFAEIFFLAKEEIEIINNSRQEKQLYTLLNKQKKELKDFAGGTGSIDFSTINNKI